MTANPLGTLEQAILALSDRDQDMASTRNDIGYSGADTVYGNSLADQLRAGRYLSARQRESAVKMIRKYEKQLRSAGVDIAGMFVQPVTPPRPSSDAPVEAAVPGRCTVCESNFPKGTLIRLARNDNGSWSRRHDVCPGGPEQPEHNLALTMARQRAATPSVKPEFAPVAPVALDKPLSAARLILGPDGSIARSLDGYEAREAQLEMTDTVAKAIDTEQHATIEAGTGTGKSLGYLVPAILSGKRVIVSTKDKNLQAQIVNKDIPFLQREGVMPAPFTAALLKGRGNYICLESVDSLVKRGQFPSPAAAEAWGPLTLWMAQEQVGDLDAYDGELPSDLKQEVTTDSDSCLGQKCPFIGKCFPEAAKTRAENAQVVVVNHSLLLANAAIRAASEGQAKVLPNTDLLVIDESHSIEDIARDAFASEITLGRWNRLYNKVDRLTADHPTVKKALADLKKADAGQEAMFGDLDPSVTVRQARAWETRLTACSELVDGLFRELTGRFEDPNSSTMRLGDEARIGDPLVAELRSLASAMEGSQPDWLEGDREREAWNKARKGLLRLERDLGLVLLPTPGMDDYETYVRYVERERSRKPGGEARLKLVGKPIDVAPFLRDNLFESYRSVIATSATIATAEGFGFWRERVGCDTALELVVGSPFDYARNAQVYLPSNAKAFDPRQARGDSWQYFEAVAAEIEQLILSTTGGAFVLFTSNQSLEETYRRLSPRLRHRLVLRQGERPPASLIREFKEAGDAVLFGTKTFWEGVDVQGSALSLVIVDKLPFAPPDDPTWSALCDAVNRKHHDEWAWFSRLAIPNATIQLKQAFGRLIRTKQDRGTVALLDGRLTLNGYGTRILRALPPATVVRSLDAVAAHFAS